MNTYKADQEEKSVPRTSQWQLRTRVLALPRRPLVMGIVNVTPDSFWDGGRHFSSQAAIDHALQLIQEGADLLDVGGESTRPSALPVEPAEQLRRVLPVIEALASQASIPVSVDTSSAAVACEAIAAGVEIVNDVTGLEKDAAMVATVVELKAAVVAMHMQGTPQTMQDAPHYTNAIEEIYQYLLHRRDTLIAAGVERERICLDPGIGFGKTAAHNLEILSHCHRFHNLGCPVLVGHSQKSFLGHLLGDPKADRTAGTLAISLALANQGVQILRVHQVAATRQALSAYEGAGQLT